MHYRTVFGRFLLKSGTFREKRVSPGRKINKCMSDGYPHARFFGHGTLYRVAANCSDPRIASGRHGGGQCDPQPLLWCSVPAFYIPHTAGGSEGTLCLPSALSTFRTQRVALKERFACLLPSAAIAALCGRPCYLRMERPVFLAKLCSRFHKRWTSGMSTGNSWSLRNGYHHLHSHKKAPAILQTDAFLYSSISIDLWTILF